jgi:hypothetical protein
MLPQIIAYNIYGFRFIEPAVHFKLGEVEKKKALF